MSESQDHESLQQVPGSSSPTFYVVVNDEGQYSIWDTRRDLPNGWRATGFVGPEATCLDHIDAIWTDMRPATLREMQADT